MEMFLEIGEDMMPIGTILPFAGQVLPDKFLWAAGGLVNIADYPDLYNVIGNAFGTSGEGFYLPDLKARVPVGVHLGYPSLFSFGQAGGEIAHSLTISEMPAHSHNFSFHSSTGSGPHYPVIANRQSQANRTAVSAVGLEGGGKSITIFNPTSPSITSSRPKSNNENSNPR
ncbi:MAG: hypothetical protein HC875_36235 [Anaerolineales bacterium]|nr:hypothetical protein [Anaerolineales bacterium]